MKLGNVALYEEAIQKNYILQDELAFAKQTEAVVKAVLSDSSIRFVTLSGPTCSGKTTTAARIIKDLQRAGKRVAVVSFDDFFRNTDTYNRNDVTSDAEKVDFDSIDALDLPFIHEIIEGIKTGKTVYMPTFDFKRGLRSQYHILDSKAYDLFLFEGIQAVYPEITSLFDDRERLSVFSNVFEDVEIAGSYFTSRDVRLIRRIVRDHRTRGASPAFTMYLWASVIANEEKNILPYAASANFLIDSFLPYELHVLRDPFLNVMQELPENSPFAAEKDRLYAQMMPVMPMSARYVPADSICREFIGELQ